MNLIQRLIASNILHLDKVNRYSGIYLVHPDTVASHTTSVGLIAISLAREIMSTCDFKVDLGEVALKALVHDIDESQSCDIPRHVKYYNDQVKSSLDEIAELSVKELDKAIFSNDEFLLNEWLNAKDTSLEGTIVKVADLLHVVYKIIEEVSFLNNRYMLKVAIDCRVHISKTIKKYSDMSLETGDPLLCSYGKIKEVLNDADFELEMLIADHKKFITQYNITGSAGLK